jgi:hypothetical protein
MAETTKPTSGTSTQSASTSASPGGTRNSSNPSSTTATSSSGSSSQEQRSQFQQPQSAPRSALGQERDSNHGSQTQGQRQGERGERREDEHHVGLTGHAMSDVKKVGSELVGAARDSAASLIDAQRARAAEQITAVGDALRRSMESFGASGSSALVQYTNRAADQICGFADAVRDRSWSDLAVDLESFARRSPTLFMVSAVGLGFIAGRFLLSSSDRTDTASGSSTAMPGSRANDIGRDVGGVSRPVPSGSRAEYGTSGIRE